MTVLAVIALFVVLFMVFISTVLLVIGPVMLLQPNRRTIEFYRKITPILRPSDVGLIHEELTITTAEGIPLHCWLIKADGEARGTVIFLHGVGECVIVGLPIARRLHDAGFHVFLYDSRRHGDSGGQFCTYGFYEKHDTSTMISYLEGRQDLRVGKIGLLGSSMGAAVAIQVAALDARVASVLAESGFATLRTVYDEYQKRIIKVPWHYLRNIVIKRSEHIAHFKASAVSPLEAVRNVKVPVFFMHGTADHLIKAVYTQRVFAKANEPKELWLIPGAKHNNMAGIGGEEYFRRIVEFFERTLKN